MSTTEHEQKKPTTGWTNTLNQDEVNKFRSMSSDWWNPNGVCKPLHSMNRLRIPLVRDGLVSTGAVDKETSDPATPLLGTRILDIGCGAGLVSEQLARIGAQVTGLDACQESIDVARSHMAKDAALSDRLAYSCESVEEHVANNPGIKYDAVVASEIVEHVENPEVFVQLCVDLVRDGGSCFFTTINRTTRSWMAAIVGAEYLLGLLPRGTHDWNKFITTEELQAMLEKSGCQTRLVHGMFYVPGVNRWFWVGDTAVNYALQAVKTKEN